MAVVRAVAWRLFADSKIRTASFAALLFLYAFAQVVGYRHAYPTTADRIEFARTFGINKALQLFYGVPRNLESVGGYTAWRFGGFGSIIVAVWALFASVKALRGEEDSGRQELVLAGVVSRKGVFGAAVSAIVGAGVILLVAILVALLAGSLPAAGSIWLTLATMSPAVVFAGAGAVASQLAASRRLALQLGIGALLVAFALRVIADVGDVGWLRWASPLGWAEEVRAFAGARPLVLLLPLVTGTGLLVLAAALSVRRDVGSGIFRSSDSSAPHRWGLSSPTAMAFRTQVGLVAAWVVGIAAFGLVVGFLSTSFSLKTLSKSLQETLKKLGGASIVTPSGALGFYFLFFVLVISLFACAQIGAARHEEADQQLETILALPVSRLRWLGGRLVLAAGLCAALALVAGVFSWIGAAAQSAGVALGDLLEAGLNCLPASFLFLGVGVLAYAVFPRAGAGIAYAFVTVAYLWDLLGSLLGAPGWLVNLTPFRHVGLVPAEPFRAGAAAAMLAIAAGSAVLALALFRRRDLAES
jgi:ABC-2 type transport system permease protein